MKNFLRSSLLIVMLLLMFGGSSYAQLTAREPMTLVDAVSAKYRPQSWRLLHWLDEASFAYSPDYLNMLRWQDGTSDTLFRGTDLIPEGMTASPTVLGLRWDDAQTLSYLRGNKLFRYQLEGGTREEVMQIADHEEVERGPGMEVAYIQDHNLYVQVPGKEAVAVTTDGNADLTYGIAAHRSEFGITKGLFWSPGGDKLAFYQIDQSNIPDFPLLDYEQSPVGTNYIRYPMAGQASQAVRVGVYDLATETVTYLQTGEPLDQYLTNITWSPDGGSLYVAIVNRDQNHLWLKCYAADNGVEIALLFEETDEAYVEPEHGPIFLPNDPDHFLWFSERDNWQHLYLYQADGTLVKQLTQGPWEVSALVGFHPEKSELYYLSTEVSPLERHLYSLDWENGKKRQLTDHSGMNEATLSPEGSRLLNSWSSLDAPWSLQIIGSKKGKVAAQVYEAEDPMAKTLPCELELVTLAAEDGSPLYGRLIKPHGFDPSQRYPAVVYLYGGPHVQLVENTWLGGAQPFLYYLAQQGYVVFTIDNRGSANRGLAFEQATFRQLGSKEIEDQATGAAYLAALPYVDADRMGVYGWSYGGFMTTSLMLRKPGLFQVGVAGGPVIGWDMYEVMYTERYMDTPETNPEGFEEADLRNYVGQLEGKLLLIHGQQDDVVVPQHTYRFLRECIKEGVQVDYFPYPSHPHNVRGIDRAHLLGKIADYFDLYLKQ